jgi:hypothetical protein
MCRVASVGLSQPTDPGPGYEHRSGDAYPWEGILLLIVYYVGFMIAGDLSDYVIGLIVEREFGSQASLIVFLALYFLFLWLSWLLAVWMTEPKPMASTARR